MKVRFASDDYGTAISNRLEILIPENRTTSNAFNIIQYERNRYSISDEVYISWAIETPYSYVNAYSIYRDGTYRKTPKVVHDRMYININKDAALFMERRK